MKKFITFIVTATMCLQLGNLVKIKAIAQKTTLGSPHFRIVRTALWLTPSEIETLRRNNFAVHGDYTPEDSHLSLIRTWYDVFLPGWELIECGFRCDGKILCQVNDPYGHPVTLKEVREFLNKIQS